MDFVTGFCKEWVLWMVINRPRWAKFVHWRIIHFLHIKDCFAKEVKICGVYITNTNILVHSTLVKPNQTEGHKNKQHKNAHYDFTIKYRFNPNGQFTLMCTQGIYSFHVREWAYNDIHAHIWSKNDFHSRIKKSKVYSSEAAYCYHCPQNSGVPICQFHGSPII